MFQATKIRMTDSAARGTFFASTRLPPSDEIKNPAMMAVKMPAPGFSPLAMANAIAKGSATMPTVTPALMSLSSRWFE